MYMSTRANLDYWSTDNCCVRWSLRKGACAIGVFSLVWQSVMMSAGVLMLVQCPIPPEANLTNHVALEANDTTTTNLTNHVVLEANDTITTNLTNHVVLEANDTTTTGNLTNHAILEAIDATTTNLTNHVAAEPNHNHVPSTHTFPTNQEKAGIISFTGESGGCVSEFEGSSNNSSSSNSSSSSSNNSSSSSSSSTFWCPWLPEPETEILGVKDEGTLMLVAGIFVTYSSIYCILSFSVVLGTIKGSVHLLQGWVAFTSFHNILILVFLLVPLPFTTLPHLLFSITHFVASLYMWAVVKSYMHTLKVDKKQVVIPEDAITDFSVDGVDVTEIPVEV